MTISARPLSCVLCHSRLTQAELSAQYNTGRLLCVDCLKDELSVGTNLVPTITLSDWLACLALIVYGLVVMVATYLM